MAEDRKRYIVGVRKLPYAQRDLAHRVITDDDPRGFMDIIGADTDDDHEVFPVGSDTTYSVELTEAEAEEFRAASNVRYLEEDGLAYPRLGGTAIPRAATLAYMDATFSGSGPWDGHDVPIAIVDSGTTAAVRSYMGFTLLGRQVFGTGTNPSPAEVWSDGINHGCLVAPCGVPAGGRFYDLLVSLPSSAAPVSASAAAFRWAADEGCKIVNYSYGAQSGASAFVDAIKYMQDRDVQLFVAAGNDDSLAIEYPAAYSKAYSNVHSIIAFDEATNLRADFSNHAAFCTGSAPGNSVLGLTRTAGVTTWSGTSAATPHAASLCVRGATGGTYTPKQVAAALRSNLRDTGQPASEQGGGAFSLQRALTALTRGVNVATTGTATDAFSSTVTTTAPGSVVSWLGADWIPVTTGTPAYRSGAVPTAEHRTTAVNYWSAEQPAATVGPQTIGMTAPTGQKWSLLAVELKPVK